MYHSHGAGDNFLVAMSFSQKLAFFSPMPTIQVNFHCQLLLLLSIPIPIHFHRSSAGLPLPDLHKL